MGCLKQAANRFPHFISVSEILTSSPFLSLPLGSSRLSLGSLFLSLPLIAQFAFVLQTVLAEHFGFHPSSNLIVIRRLCLILCKRIVDFIIGIGIVISYFGQ